MPTRISCWALLASLLTIAAVASTVEPLELRFRPEQGLAVTYELTAEGQVTISMPGGAPETQAIRASGRYIDRVVSVQGNLRSIERRLKNMTVEFGGQKQEMPQEMLSEVQTIVMNELGVQVESKASGKEDTAGTDPFEILTAGLGFIPFCEKAVEIGDEWDNSKAMTVLSRDLHVAAATTLESIYDSAGMRVALTQTELRVEGSMRPATTPGAGPSPVVSVSLRGAVLQSSRIEDGCLLGMKSTMSGSATMEMPGVGSMRMDMKDINMRLEVAG